MINDGGPAFKETVEDFDCATGEVIHRHKYWGVSLRDYFAAHAPEVILDRSVIIQQTKEGQTVEQILEFIADVRYRYADKMIARREK